MPDQLRPDVMFPRIDGFQVCHRLCSNWAARQGHPPIPMLSAKSQEADRAMGAKDGTALYLIKRVAPEEPRAAFRGLPTKREIHDV